MRLIPPRSSINDKPALFMWKISYIIHGIIWPNAERRSLCAKFYGQRHESMLAFLWVQVFTEAHCRKSYDFWRERNEKIDVDCRSG